VAEPRRIRQRVKALMAEWDTLRWGLSEREAAEAWAESIARHEDQCPDLKPQRLARKRLANG
jgi:hypothetical protein